MSAVNVVTLDMVHVLERTPGLADETGLRVHPSCT